MRMPFEGHRCFKIPKAKLDLFLVALRVNFHGDGFEAEMVYVFDVGEVYDVVVATYGSSVYYNSKLEEFVSKL